MPIKEFVDTVGPFRGMRWAHQYDPDPAYCEVIRNGYPLDPILGGPIVLRPTIGRNGTAAFGTGTGNVQFAGSFYLNGAVRNIVIADGVVYYATYGASPTEMLTQANFATASITVSTSLARFEAVMLGGELVVNTGGSDVWSWDGTANGGLTKLSNCPQLRVGSLTVYYAKLFGVKVSDPQTIVWSEENDPATGYEAGGCNNAWTLSQSDSDELMALEGTNEALYFFRKDSIGSIRGAVTSTFTSDGTLDGVSTKLGVGDRSFPAVYHYQDRIWFIDQVFRPQCFYAGSIEVVPLWQSLAAIFEPLRIAAGGMGVGTVDFAGDIHIRDTSYPYISHVPGTHLVMFCYPDDTDSDQASHFFVFDIRTLEAQGYWTFEFPMQAVAAVEFTDPALLLCSANGWGFSMFPQYGTSFDRGEDNAVDEVAMEIVGPMQFNAHDFDFHFDRCDILLETYTQISLGIGYYTPTKVWNDTSMTTQRVTVEVRKGTSPSYVREKHVCVGLSGDGRWFKLYLTTADNPGTNVGTATVLGWTVTGFPMQRHPASY